MTKGKAILGFLIIVTAVSFSGYTDDQIIGVVLSVKGKLLLAEGEETRELLAGDAVRKTTSIELAEGERRAKVQIGSHAGPIVYTRFPVTFDISTLQGLSREQEENYIACLGGTPLRSKTPSRSALAWKLDMLGAIHEESIEAGFSVVMSPEKSSSENLSLDPVYFRMVEGLGVKKVTFSLQNNDLGKTVVKEKQLERQNDGFVFSFASLPLNHETEYQVNLTFVLKDGAKISEFFVFFVYGDAEINFIEEEAAFLLSGDENDFEKGLIRAGTYRNYAMHLKALAILKDIGIDIEGMFTQQVSGRLTDR